MTRVDIGDPFPIENRANGTLGKPVLGI